MAVKSRFVDKKETKTSGSESLLMGFASIFTDSRGEKDAPSNVRVIAKLIDDALDNPGKLKTNAMSNIRAAADKAAKRFEEVAPPEAKGAIAEINKQAQNACKAVENLTDDEAVVARVQTLLGKSKLPDLSRILNGKSAPAAEEQDTPKKTASPKGAGMNGKM